MVVAGVGIEHEKLVDLVQKYFVDELPVWETNPEILIPGNFQVDKSTAQYSGGLVQVKYFLRREDSD